LIRGKVVLVPFPFDDLSTTKVRPAVCLTEAIGPHRHVLLAFVTSGLPAEVLPTDIIVDASHADFGRTGLRMTSTIRLHRLMTVAMSLIQRELGELPPRLEGELLGRLRALFE
jgi:mRNA-degrading endonuclease toxin of MazEF toxin-antitoxin module